MAGKHPQLPGLGYAVASCVISLSATDLRSRTIHGSVGLLLKKVAPSNEQENNMLVEEQGTTLRLNSRNLVIESVRVDSKECNFRVLDYMRKLVGERCRDLLSLSACLAGDLVAAGEGELEINLDRRPSEDVLSIEIDYSFKDGVAVFCLNEGSEESDMDDHMFTNIGFSYSSELGGGCGARCIFPCVDTTKSRYPIKIFIETHRDHVAVAPGKLVRTFTSSPSTHIFEFDNTIPIAPYSVGFAVGAFVKISHPTFPWFSTYALASRAGRFIDVPSKITSFVTEMLGYLGQSETPPAEYSQVFVAGEMAADKILPFNSLSILSDDLVYERDLEWVSTEMELDSLFYQCVGLACQWFGCGPEMGASSPGDAWIPTGLAMFTAMEALRLSKGDTFFHLLLTKWSARVRATHAKAAAVMAHHIKPGIVLGRPLARPKPYALPVDAALWAVRGCSFDSSFAFKAGLTMHMIHQRATTVVFRDVLRKLAKASRGSVPKTNPRGGRTMGLSKPKLLSELGFLTLLKSRAGAMGQDINSTFVMQWLRHSYVPRFIGKVTYLDKKNRIEVRIRQNPPEGGRIYMGAVKVRVIESNHLIWEREMKIDNIEHLWEFECRTTRKMGRGGRRKSEVERQNKEWKNIESLDAQNALTVAESRNVNRFWDSTAPVQYVLLDPNAWWIMDLTWELSEEFWQEMIHDRTVNKDVLMLRFAIDQLCRQTFSKESHIRAASMIAALVTNRDLEDAIRVDAARALLLIHEKSPPSSVNISLLNTSSSNAGTWIAKDLLVTVFKELFCDETGDPLPFSVEKGGYPVRAALLETLSAIRAKDGTIPEDVKTLIFESIRLCDNANNPFDDGPLLSSLAVATGRLLAGMKREEEQTNGSNGPSSSSAAAALSDLSQDSNVAEAIRWIRSALDFDSVSPSPRNRKATTIGCLEALCELEIAKLVPAGSTNFAVYLEHSFWRRDADVRLKAFECIARLHIKERFSRKAKWMSILHWLIRAAANDPCIATRSKMMKILLSLHADTIDRTWPELKNNKSPAGCFWPLLESPSDMAPDELQGARAVANSLWELMNEKSAFDCGLRILSHQLWRLIWALNDVPALDGLNFVLENLGHLEKWVEEAEQEYARDEQAIIHLEEFKSIQARQMELAKEMEEEKRLREERFGKEPEPAPTTPGATSVSSDKDVIIQEGEEEEEFEEEEEEEGLPASEDGSSNPVREDGARSTDLGEVDDDEEADFEMS